MKLIHILLSSLLIFFFTACTKNEVEKFTIGTNFWPGYQTLHLAQELDYYKTDIDLKSYKSSTVVLNKFRKKEIQAAALTLDEVLLLKDQGYSPVIIAILDISDGADVIISKKDIKNIEQLKNKTIGVENSALGSFVINRALQLSNMQIEDIKIFSLELDKHEEAFNNALIDAVVTFEPLRSKLLQTGANEIFNSSQIPNEIVDLLVVDKDYLNTKYIGDILQALEKSTKKILSLDEESISLVSQNLSQSNEEFINSLNGLKIPKLEDSAKYLKDGTLLKTIEKVQGIMIQNALIKEGIDPKSIIHAR